MNGYLRRPCKQSTNGSMLVLCLYEGGKAKDDVLKPLATMFEREEGDASKRKFDMYMSGPNGENDTEILARIIKCVSTVTGVDCFKMSLFTMDQSFEIENYFLLDTCSKTQEGSNIFLWMNYWHGAKSCHTKLIYSSEEGTQSTVDRTKWIPVVNPCWKWVQMLHNARIIVQNHGMNFHEKIEHERNMVKNMSYGWKSIFDAIASTEKLERQTLKQTWSKYLRYGWDVLGDFKHDLDAYRATIRDTKKGPESLVLCFVACKISRKNSSVDEYVQNSTWNRLLCKFHAEQLTHATGFNNENMELRALVHNTVDPIPRDPFIMGFRAKETILMCTENDGKSILQRASYVCMELAASMMHTKDSLSLSVEHVSTEKLSYGRIYRKYVISKRSAAGGMVPVCQMSIEAIPHSSLCVVQLSLDRVQLETSVCMKCGLPRRAYTTPCNL